MTQSSSSNKQNGRAPTHTPNPEVVPRAARRQFSAAYKRRIVAEAEQCTKRGAIGALLRREGLYSSYLSNWRRELAAGTVNEKRRGRPAEPLAAENAQLRRENERLRRELEKTQLIVDAQKKLAEVLGLMGENEAERTRMIQIAENLGQHVGVKRACEDLGVPRSSLYHARQPAQPAAPRTNPARAPETRGTTSRARCIEQRTLC